MAADTDTPTDATVFQDWRIANFEELGFSKDEATMLASAVQYNDVKTKQGLRQYAQPLHYLRVRKLLEDGHSKEQILQVYSPF